MKIGVISDTHNYFDLRLPELFAGVDHIFHAGDIGLPMIVMELEAIAPVTAVLGNNDDGLDFRETEVVQLGALKFLVHHIVNVHDLSDVMKSRMEREKPDVVVFGHSHKPFNQVIDGALFFNPGYAGKPRFGQTRSIAILHCEGKGVRPEFIELDAVT